MKANRHALFAAFFVLATFTVSHALAQSTSDETKKQKRVTAKVVDGKVIIVDSDGKTRTIDLGQGDAKGIVLEEKLEVKGDDEKRTARAIIVGPDGETHEVELDGLQTEGVLRLPGLKGQLKLGGDGQGILLGDGERLSLQGLAGIEGLGLGLGGQKFMIGVSCSELEGALKAHLGLDHGLVVEQVVDDSPSEAAGVKQFDVIVKIDGNDATNLKHLVEAVQKAGEDDRTMKFSLLRGGHDFGLEIKPEKRKAASLSFDVTGDNEGEIREKVQNLLKARGLPETGEFRFERVMPGLIQGGRSDGDLQNEIEDLKKQIQELKDALRQLKDK